MKKIRFIIIVAISAVFAGIIGFSAVSIREVSYLKDINDKTMQVIKRQRKVFKKVLDRKKKEISKFKKENNLLAGRLNGLSVENLALKKKVASLKYNIKATNALKTEVQQLKATLRTISGRWKERLRLANKEAAVLNKSRRALKNSIFFKNKELNKFKAENERLNSLLSNLKISRDKYILAEKDLKRQISEIRRSNLKIKAKLNLARKKTEEISKSKDTLEKELSQFRLKKSASDKEIKELKTKIAFLNAAVRHNQAALKKKTGQLNELSSMNGRMKKKLAAAGGLIRNVEQLKSALSGKAKDISALKGQLNKVENDNARLRKELADSKEKINNIRTILGARAEKILVLQDELTRQDKDMERLNVKVNTYIKELAMTREEYLGSKIENIHLVQELEDKNRKLLQFQNEIEQMMQINSELRDRIKKVSELFNKNPSRKHNKNVEVKLKAVDTKGGE